MIHLGSIPIRVKNWLSNPLCLTFSLTFTLSDDSVENKPASLPVVPLEKVFNKINTNFYANS